MVDMVAQKNLIKWVAILVLAALMGVGIWQFTEYQKKQRIEQASRLYETLMQASRQKDLKRVRNHAETLMADYAKTPYAPLSAMILARFEIERGDFAKGIEYLKFAVQKGGKSLEPIGRVRLARVLANDGQYDEALQTLTKEATPEGFASLYEEVKGDIYYKKNDLEKAKEAYGLALKSAPEGVPMTALQLKFNEIN